MSRLTLMKIIVLVTILCALPFDGISIKPTNAINSNTSWVIEQSSGLHVFNAASYPNGPIILRLIRSGANNCYEPYLYLRLIFPNINISNISTNNANITAIPTFNFCPISTNPPRDLIRIFPLSYNYAMIAFLQNNTENSLETHEEVGMFIDWEGNIIEKMSLGFINFTSSDTSSLGTLVIDSSQSYAFMWVNRVSQKEYIRWQIYSIFFTNGGKFSIIPSHQYEIFALIDGGYCFVIAGPSDTQWVANAVFIRKSYATTQPSLIYQDTSQAVSMKIETCDKFNTYYKPELVCVFSIKTNTSNISTRYLKVAFSSSGAAKTPSKLNINDTTFDVDKIYQLWSGGYLLVVRLKTDNSLIGYIYDIQGNFSNSWGSPSLPGNMVIQNGVFLNNTVWIFSDANSTISNTSNWTLTTTIAPKFAPDHFPNITFLTRELLITFYNQVALSAENISIYQDSNTGLIPRLYYNALSNSNKFNISPDLKEISISVLNSTFVSSQSQYYVVMDNNFVKDWIHDEPLLGTSLSVSTGPKSDVVLGDSEYALIRLNMNESVSFNSLSKSGKSDYLNQLKNELAHSVPIDPSNIVAISQYQWDSDANNLQILLKFQILPGNNSTKDLTVMKVIKTLNDLITNRDVT
ncbi:21510_t:CDS:2 [Gigaspora rosea]|nr:21510_t:CDS:2 [Gigaspora rosea]